MRRATNSFGFGVAGKNENAGKIFNGRHTVDGWLPDPSHCYHKPPLLLIRIAILDLLRPRRFLPPASHRRLRHSHTPECCFRFAVRSAPIAIQHTSKWNASTPDRKCQEVGPCSRIAMIKIVQGYSAYFRRTHPRFSANCLFSSAPKSKLCSPFTSSSAALLFYYECSVCDSWR